MDFICLGESGAKWTFDWVGFVYTILLCLFRVNFFYLISENRLFQRVYYRNYNYRNFTDMPIPYIHEVQSRNRTVRDGINVLQRVSHPILEKFDSENKIKAWDRWFYGIRPGNEMDYVSGSLGQ